jgi:hypothetical protein
LTSPHRSSQPARRFGARAVLALVALALVAVPFGLLLFLVQSSWDPLLDVDEGARDELHGYAAGHPAFVTAMKVLSTIGSAPVYLVAFAGGGGPGGGGGAGRRAPAAGSAAPAEALAPGEAVTAPLGEGAAPSSEVQPETAKVAVVSSASPVPASRRVRIVWSLS